MQIAFYSILVARSNQGNTVGLFSHNKIIKTLGKVISKHSPEKISSNNPTTAKKHAYLFTVCQLENGKMGMLTQL